MNDQNNFIPNGEINNNSNQSPLGPVLGPVNMSTNNEPIQAPPAAPVNQMPGQAFIQPPSSESVNQMQNQTFIQTPLEAAPQPVNPVVDNGMPQNTVPTPPVAPQTNTQSAPEQPKKKSPVGLIIAIVVILIVGGFVSITVLSTNSALSSIDRQRGSMFVNTAKEYINVTKRKMEAGLIDLKSDDTLLFVPAGSDDNYSMILIESGGQSPFDTTYLYAYVIIEKVSNGFKYQFVASDGSKKGIYFATEEDLNGTDPISFVRSGMDTDKTGIGACHKTLKQKYQNNTIEDGTLSSLDGCDGKIIIDNIIKVNNYKICSNKGCK